MKTLHLTWIAFFITFVTWFNLAPLLEDIQQTFGLTSMQIKTLLVLNVSLAIPARIIVGMMTDQYGPRKVYSGLLFLAAFPCFAFAFSTNFTQLAIARFLLGFIGAGFVIDIRMVSEWFPHHQLGTAEGIYGGWGNFGSAVAAFTLPTLALMFGGEDGWRYAVAITGLICLFYSFVYYANVRDVPEGSHYFKPRSKAAMEVTSKADLLGLLIMKVPLYLALALLAWNLTKAGMLTDTMKISIWVGLAIVYVLDSRMAYKVNMPRIRAGIPEIQRYKFKQVAVLNILYFATFGSELAVISMLPLFFAKTFGLSAVAAGMIAAGYAFMNLMSRPGGGWISDRFGRKSTLLILTAGLALGYLAMSFIGSDWSVWAALLVAMACSFFV
ncbi:MAG: MFS transporter, partial [Robiginitomaculum sp.]|nr:MFS transporter [Robiginitomaculum sp.]